MMSDPPQPVGVRFSTWLSVPEGPPEQVWASALSRAIATEEAGSDDESTVADVMPRYEGSAADDVIGDGDDPAEIDPVEGAGSGSRDAGEDAVTCIWTGEGTDGDNGH